MNRPLSIDLRQQLRSSTRNATHTWLLAGSLLLVLLATAWALAGPSGIFWAFVFGVVSMMLIRRATPQMVLTMYKAREVTREAFPAGYDIVAALSERAGLPNRPKLYVIPSKMMNAFAVGRRDDAAIAVTDALARQLTVRELAGVLAHEITHVANEDLKVMAFADMVTRYASIASFFGYLAIGANVMSTLGGGEVLVPWLAVALLVLSPTIGGLLQMALSRTREFDADLGAAILTGDPDGLASALQKLEKAQGVYWESLMLPGSRAPVPSILRTHPKTGERVARLMALKSGETIVVEDGGPAMAAPRPRPSLVPRIPPVPQHHRAAFMAMPAVELPEPDSHACPGGLGGADGKPRVRVTRGGVYF
jgi:heat shock protein HtpX